jgi:hypothetical protein
MGVKGNFLDFSPCLVCKDNKGNPQMTRHYTLDKPSKAARIRKVYCEVCRTVSVQFRSKNGDWE